MSEKLLNKHPIHPLIGLPAAVLILVFGLITAKSISCIWYLAGMWILFLAFGYWRACLAVIPVAAAMSLVPVSYTHLDVYKRQLMRRLIVYL